MARAKIGVWIIGIKGGVASTVATGLVALRKGWTSNTALVSELPQFSDLGLVDWNDLVVGGHDIRNASIYDGAMQLARDSRALDPELVTRCKPELDKFEKNVRSGTLVNVGSTIEKFAEGEARGRRETPRAALERIQNDLKEFVAKNKLDRVVVINLASTEPPVDESKLPTTWKELSKLIDKPRNFPLAASSLYAMAAIDLGHPYINFTPSAGSAPQAICDLALERNVCHMGHDGKTGETLMKSSLAPMFANRNLQVLSWVGHNIFGNMDAKVLDDPANKATKVRSKDRLLHQILGYSPQTLVTIENIESLGDWKTAWDHIHFRGFLNTPMVLQFIWQGTDSLLAAPLAIDLIRFTERAQRHGERGLLTFLASFFKSPLGVKENDFVRQFQMLEAWAGRVRETG